MASVASPERLTVDLLQPTVGSVYRIAFEDVTVELTLAEMNVITPDRFALYFRGPKAYGLRQATYAMDHDDLGRVALFIVPVGLDDQGYEYEAVFNRLPPSSD